MVKKKLSELVQKETQRCEPTESESYKETDLQTYKETTSNSPRVTELLETNPNQAATQPSHEETDLQSTEVPKYLTLIRKEARLREDQIEELATLSRRLNRQRGGKGERITENTLIRVAVDWLLQHSEMLAGISEEEVRESLGQSKSL